MIIGYARVSRTDQETALQLDALQRAGCTRIYTEKVSGASRERPELTKCLDALRAGDTLVVWHLDRLGRSIKDLIDIVTNLNAQKIGFKSLTQSDIDTTTANGTLIFHVFAALAEYERARLQERTRAGLVAAKARGRVGGRPRALSDDDARKALAMIKGEVQKSEVARHFKVSRPTLNAALERVTTNDN